MMKQTWRRRFIRFLGWWIAAFASFFAVVLLAFALYLLFFDYPEALRERLETELSRVSGAPAHIGSIGLDITSYAFELRDVRVGGRGGVDEPNILTLDRVWGRLRLSEIARLRLHWTELVVQGLSVRLVAGSEGELSLPRDVDVASAPALAGAGVAFSADRIALEDAVFLLSNESVPWQLEASNLGLELSRGRGDSYKGTLSYDDGVLVFRDGERIEGSFSADIELSAGELLVHEARGESELGLATARGKLGFGGGYNGRFDVEAEVDLELAGSTLLDLDLTNGAVSGIASFDGSLTLSPDNRELEGKLALPAGRLHGVPLRAWTADVFWDRSMLHVSLAQGRLASGSARVSLQQTLPADEHPTSLELDLSNAVLSEVLAGLAFDRGRSSPLESIVSGRASFVIPPGRERRIDGSFELAGSLPPTGPPTGVVSDETEGDSGSDVTAIAFIADGHLRAGAVEISSSTWETASARGTVHGVYPRVASAELTVEVQSDDLARADALARNVRRWVRAAGEDDPDLWGIAGRGRASGRLTGRFPHPTFDGALEASILQFDRLRLEDVRTHAVLSRGRISFDDLSGRRGGGMVTGLGSLALEGPVGSRDFALDVHVSAWPFMDLATLVDLNLEAEGLVSGDLALSRVSGELDGVAELEVAAPSLFEASFDHLEARARFVGQTIRLDRAVLQRGDAHVSGTMVLAIDSGAIEGDLSADAFPLDGSHVFGLELSGELDADAAFAGHVDAPVIEISARGHALELDGTALSDATINARVVNDDLTLDLKLGDELSLEADAELIGDVPISGNLRFVELDAGSWFARISESFSSATGVVLTGGARFTAELRRSGSLGIDATLTRVVVESDRARLESLAPVEARYRDGIAHLPSLTLAQDASRVAIGGTVNFGARSLDLRLEGMTELGLVQTLYPDLTATGNIDLSARVSGSWDSPSLSGRADLDGSSLRLEGFPQALGGLRGRLVFDNRTIRIPELHGVFGSGPVTFSGAISLEGLSAGSLDLTASGTGMRLRYPEGLVAVLDADLTLLGSRDAPVLGGEIVLTDAVWTREYDLVAGILTDSEGQGLFEEVSENDLFSALRFDLAVVAPRTLRLRNSLAEIDGSAELELRGSLAQPVLLGTTEAERGEVYFLGQRYDITAGKVDFVDPTKVEPFIELVAETRVRSYRVELRLTGTSDRFYPELSSDPPLRTVDILRLLSGANERDILIGTEEEELAGVGVASLLTERLSQELGRRAERLFGLDRFSIDPFLVGQIANPTARVSLGKQITRDLSVNYSTNLNATTEAIILIEYTPEGNTSWILSRDEEGDVGIDVKFRKSF